ncbi:MAG: class IV adenylate cyclase [Planctomycetes bacterium]|nr:class IV adenylate cyclase [Planctomycetota bacterium]
MLFEVEQKFRVANFDAVGRRLSELGITVGDPVEQVDTYFRHPQRDFARTDEALRLRREGVENRITYKGPKIDGVTKTRREIELAFEPGSDRYQDFTALLMALGFTTVADVRKIRRSAPTTWETIPIIVTLDRVDQVGTFVEIETQADAGMLDQARAHVQSLAAALGLDQPERRSYLELLLVHAQ